MPPVLTYVAFTSGTNKRGFREISRGSRKQVSGVPADIVDVRPLNRAIIQDSTPVIHGAETCERLMLSYANGMRFELPTLSARSGEISPHYAYIFRILHTAFARANTG